MRTWGGQRKPSSKVKKRVAIQLTIDPRKTQQGLEFACKSESAAPVGKIQRLLSKMIACEKQYACAEVQNTKGEHAAQPSSHFLAEVLIKMDQNLGITACAQAVTLISQFSTELQIIVNFTIKDDADCAV